ncbi:MAG: phenylacetate-CoA oxygenase subunit PaaJ [Planctomycetes bacterium]|nr:phenylacetate-CoA oxygenase subunit PaaJ [Planctomycetota bacterium]
MIDTESIMDVLREIPDPEMPISIVDLGLVEDVRIETNGDSAVVSIDILPTFVGCPALPMIENEIRTKVGAVEGVGEVSVQFIYDPPWSVDRISDDGRRSLAAHGVTVPEHGSKLDVPGHGSTVELRTSAIACPFCNSNETRLDSQFGPTRCRMIYYCESCKNSFEHMKRV